jgi:uncharacterized surface protein with fasciclin (FAS1) repeats
MVAAALLITVGLSACTESADNGNGEEAATMQSEEPAQTIVDVAMNDDRFSTLVTALDTAGLVQTLQGDGPFTVFAPTNAAFDALPEGTLEQLLNPDNRDQLTGILTYHVVDSTYMASDVAGASSLTTLEGSTISISTSGDTVMVNEAAVTATDIEASNGVIHVIDAVLQPPADESM